MKIRIVKPKAKLEIKEEYHNRQMAYYHYGDTVEIDFSVFAAWIDNRHTSKNGNIKGLICLRPTELASELELFLRTGLKGAK
jgi:hypothetical protein